MEKQPWDNERRTRYYGVRKGDIVRSDGQLQQFREEAVVTSYGFMDNNAVYVQVNGKDKPIKVVAEWLTIVTKIEDQGASL